MPPSRLLPGLALLLALAPLGAQAPHFADGAAFGGSRVFGLGLNPATNPARLASTPSGIYASWLDGTREAKQASEALRDLAQVDPALQSEALRTLHDAPWAQRLRGWGLAFAEKGALLAYTREESTALMVQADVAPGHLGSGPALGLNTSRADLRRTEVDRLSLGSHWTEGQVVYGLTFRAERHGLGQRALALNPSDPQARLSGPAFDPWAFRTVERRALSLTADAGLTVAFSEMLALGVQADRLLRRRIWDVEEKPQFRAGARLAFGPAASVCLEADLNRAARFPFPEDQRSASASLCLELGHGLSLQVGAERTTWQDASVTRGGATLRLHTPAMDLGLGFQAGADRPLKGVCMGTGR